MIIPGPDTSAFRTIRGILYVWIAVLVLALDPRTEDPAAPVKLLASALAAVAMMLVWAVALGTGRAPYRCINSPLRFLGIFFGVLGLAALLSETPDRGLQALCPWLIFAAIGFVAYQTFPHARHLRNLFRVLVACVTLSSVYGLAQYFGWDPFPWANRNVEEYRALPATYGNPNLAGHALIVALTLCAGLVADAWQRKRWTAELAAYLVLAGVMATHLGLTQMRGGVVALAILFVFVAARRLARRVGCRVAGEAGIALTACAVVFALLVTGALVLAPRLGLDSSLQLRLNSYAGAAALFLEHPWFGVGPGNYAFYNIPHWSPFEALWYALKSKRNFNVHNEWLEMAVEGGIPGLTVFIGLFLVSLITFFEHPGLPGERHRALWMAIPAAIVALGAEACLGFNVHAPVSAAFFFLLMGLQAAQPYYSAPTGKMVRRTLVPLCLLTLAVAWSLWRDYGYERSYQRAQGAVAWSRTYDEGSVDLDPIGRLLETLTTGRPDD
ncbi:MAG: O-antigen ligase family protein [Candidatus Hydrogenedentes bacterium]|nr:O-antigen ligase family protein [Candidatus Hydrogenedentota bacterium]